ncbi:hypothetical protein M408DRAFT_139899 [Serendipita vermifera MAFF 305830]|uniref:Uncharacterized protein n=1 Tax=Serendipita vermifera MAFF 305830 TaxID=933852 RepID=A0A0C3BA31_SERVB|nr:hypothetical protein M408DRAFT_139899 [Serendipita vermifera MAFF 305830]
MRKIPSRGSLDISMIPFCSIYCLLMWVGGHHPEPRQPRLIAVPETTKRTSPLKQVQ